MTTSGPEFRRQVGDCLQPEPKQRVRSPQFDPKGAKQAECFEVEAKTTPKSLLWGAISFNTRVAKLGTLAIERRKEITEAI